jgi:hypothetical protein
MVKAQIPDPKSQIPNPKPQARKGAVSLIRRTVGIWLWALGFGIFLGFGIWDLGFGILDLGFNVGYPVAQLFCRRS